jgi:hypothetical protein
MVGRTGVSDRLPPPDMRYNFVRIHQSLRVTPAMAAGVTTKLWSLTDMVRVIEDLEAARSLKIRGETMVG